MVAYTPEEGLGLCLVAKLCFLDCLPSAPELPTSLTITSSRPVRGQARPESHAWFFPRGPSAPSAYSYFLTQDLGSVSPAARSV